VGCHVGFIAAWDRRARRRAGADAAGRGPSGTYVTDGVNLYRHIVSFNPPGVRMVQLEDCMSLELLLVPAVEYRSWQVRPVIVGE